MKIKLYNYVSIVVFLAFCLPSVVQAQNRFAQNGIDSAAIDGRIQADKAKRDSIAKAIIQKRKADSTAREVAKIKLQAFRDSIVTARNAKRKADSLIREQAKQALINKKKTSDSLAKDRIRKQDSTILARKNHMDSLRLAKLKKDKNRTALEKYKNSRRYKDSVETVRKNHKDSIAFVRQTKLNEQKSRNQLVRDSLIIVRNQVNDSLKENRKHISDSTKTAVAASIEKQKTDRQKMNDSLAAIRKHRADSLAVVRKSKEKKTAETAKKKDEKQKALSIKLLHEKKQEEWTNEKLLKRKWNVPRRVYQNTVTRYNYFYNARRKYDDGIRSLKKNNKDDYTKLISLYPYDVSKSGTSVAGEMDSVIKKASFSTQIHDPRSKWFDNLYFLMAQASYIKNDFDGAITTFQFIANEYKDVPKKRKPGAKRKGKTIERDPASIASLDNRKGIHKISHHPIRNQALVGLASSYIQAEQYSEASALISTLEKDKIFPKRNKAALYLTKGTLEIAQKNNTDAIVALTNALEFKMPSLQRARTEFVIGQLYAGEGNYAQSSEHFKKSISGKANPEMDFYTKLLMAENAAKGGGDRKYAIAQLDKLIKDPKFEKYRSQANNALAGIYAEQDVDKAIDILTKSIKHMDTKEPFQKAISFAMLGKLYYGKAAYEAAKVSYDSASLYGSNPPIDNIDEVNTRKIVLTDVVKDIRIIRKQDSLLVLSQKSEKEQKAIAKKEAERLKKLEQATAEPKTQVVSLSPGTTVKSNWYFYNNTLIEKGASEFKQKWGTRKLEDNWRRSAAGSIMMNVTSDSTSGKDENKLLVNGSQYETLLAEIPTTAAKRDKANNLIMNAYYDLGLIYYAQLQDYPNSVISFDSLLKKYPSTDFKKESYYTLYLDHSLLKHDTAAARYKKLLQDEFGQSEFAKLANNPSYIEDVKNSAKAIEYYYDTTYLAYKDTQYAAAMTRIRYAQTAFKGKPMMAHFDLLEALCNAGLKDYVNCKLNLEHVLKAYPSTPQQAKAQELLNYLRTNKLLPSNDSSALAKKDSLPSQLSEIQSAEGKGIYSYDANEQHLLLVYLNTIDSRTLSLKSGISDFNLQKHESEELVTGQNLFTVKEGVISVSKFSNAIFAKIYMNDIIKDPTLFQKYKKEDYTICLISASNFTELIKTRDILGYLTFHKKNY